MAGSISLSAIAALHTGAGLVRAVVPDAILETVAGSHPAIMTTPLPCTADGCLAPDAEPALTTALQLQDAIGCGPGMTTGPGSVVVTQHIWQSSLACVFDADALNVIAEQNWLSRPASRSTGTAFQARSAPTILTPHPGELQRLTGVPADAPELQRSAAKELAQAWNVVVVLKGGPTVVVGKAQADAGDVQEWTNTTGNPGMATAGMGDLLTGILATLLAQGLGAWDAARLGVWLHGLAGDTVAERLSQRGMTAFHVVHCLPEVADSVEEQDHRGTLGFR